MSPFRRRRNAEVDAAREAFRRVASALDTAQRTLLAAVPTSRDKGVPLSDAITSFLEALDRLDALMPGWRIRSTELAWDKCSGALAEVRFQAERLLAEPSTLGFEALNARLGDVIAPLEEFAYAALSLRS